jgi:hypothetical protein
MGVQKENPITCLLGADPPVGTPACRRCIATVNLWLNVVMIASGAPPEVSPEDACLSKPLTSDLADE